jgi:hypothetical protein
LSTIKDDDADIIEGDPEDVSAEDSGDGAPEEEEKPEAQPVETAEMSG